MINEPEEITLYERVARNIRDEIFCNLNQAERYKLPSERILADRNNVSIITVRKALKVLNEAGIVTSKSRSGTYISDEVFDGKETVAIVRGMRSLSALESPWHSKLVNEIEKCLYAQGKKVRNYTLFHGTDRIDDREMGRLVEDTKTHKFIGAILQPEFHFLGDDFHVLLQENKISYISANSNSSTNSIICDYYEMGAMGAKHLYEMGARRVGIIGNKPSTCIGPQADVFGFQFGVANNPKLETCDQWICSVDATVANGISAFKSIWSSPVRPDGLMVSDEVCFHGVVMAMLEMDVRYPDDLKIVVQRTAGSEHENIFNPPSLVFSVVEEARLLVERLLSMSRDKIISVPCIKISPVLWEPENEIRVSKSSQSQPKMQTV